jgi:hypothetical protein
MPPPFSDFQQIAANPAGGEDPGSYGFGAELQNAMAPSLGMIAPQPQQGAGEAELNNALSNMRQFQARIVATQEAQKRPSPPEEITVKTDPETGKQSVTSKTSMENFEATVSSANKYHEMLGGYAKQLDAIQGQLAAEEANIRNQPPWVQLATALSANLAQGKDMPGWVQGLGRTAEQLNPRAEMIQAKRVRVLQDQAAIAEKGAALDEANLRTREVAAGRKEDRLTQAETQRRQQVERATNNLEQAISKGPGEMDPKVVAENLTRAKATPEEIKAITADLAMLASNVSKKYLQGRTDIERDAALARESEDRRNKLAAGTLAAQARTAEQKSLEEKALDAVAQSLANGELTSIKDVASMRGGQRTLIFAKARAINPKFNVGEINRKIKTAELFTTGKEGESLKSFDTFLQHAGEVTETIKGIQLTDSRLLNRSINWWRKNMKGTPELARLETSLEPVGKEFESFLLGGRALYVDDRKQIRELLDQNTPLVAVMATLNQMGKTAKDRYVAMNKRYKSVMGEDLQEPFSDEAIASASKLGIDLGVKASASTGKVVDVMADELKKLGFK